MKKTILKILSVIITLFVCAVSIICICFVYSGYSLYKKSVNDEIIEEKVLEIQSQENYTTVQELPDIYMDALLSVEDRRFYHHDGIDTIAIGRAFVDDVRALSFKEGGSTITQQLAKNLFLTQEKRIDRKIAEIFIASDLERKYTKDEILELYINSIYYGNGYYNIYDAAEGYFGKEPSELNDCESVVVVGLPNAPSKYALTENPRLAYERGCQVINKMVSNNKISEKDASLLILKMGKEFIQKHPDLNPSVFCFLCI